VPSGAPGPVLWGLVDLALSENTPAEAVITLRPAFSIAGKVAVDGAALDPASLLVRARPLSAELSLVGEPARVQPDGSFELTGLSSGSYRLDVEGLPASWAIQSMRRDDADILDTPLDVVADTAGVLIGLTNRPSRIAGRLLDAQGRPAIGCRIVVFPLQRVAWGPASRRTLMVPVASDGGYAVSGLTAGAYLLVAITDLDDNDLHDPTFLESLVPAAVPIALTPGEHRALDLRIGGEPE